MPALGAAYTGKQKAPLNRTEELRRIVMLQRKAFRILEPAVRAVAEGSCCRTPDCSIGYPQCDTMICRAAIHEVESITGVHARPRPPA